MTTVRRILDLYGRDSLSPADFAQLAAGIDFERTPFNVDIAMARLAARFPDAAEGHPLFPRLQGLERKLLVQDAWQWSHAVPHLRRLQEAGVGTRIFGDASLWLGDLKDRPRKMAGIQACVPDVRQARRLLGSRTVRGKDDAHLALQDRLFPVHTLREEPCEGFVPCRDASGLEVSLPGTELQFLLLCANHLNGITGDGFRDSCLQWMMDAVDIVRDNPGFDGQRLAALAAAYAQLGTLLDALELLRQAVPGRFAPFFPFGYAPTPAETVSARRRQRFLDLDRRCREHAYRGKPFPFLHRLAYRLRCNHYDLARYYPEASHAAILLRAPGYYFRKYLSGPLSAKGKDAARQRGTGAE